MKYIEDSGIGFIFREDLERITSAERYKRYFFGQFAKGHKTVSVDRCGSLIKYKQGSKILSCWFNYDSYFYRFFNF